MDELRLSSGRSCRLIRIKSDLIPDYYVLAFPLNQGQPGPEEVREMLTYGLERAEQLAEQMTGDGQAYTLALQRLQCAAGKGLARPHRFAWQPLAKGLAIPSAVREKPGAGARATP